MHGEPHNGCRSVCRGIAGREYLGSPVSGAILCQAVAGRSSSIQVTFAAQLFIVTLREEATEGM